MIGLRNTQLNQAKHDRRPNDEHIESPPPDLLVSVLQVRIFGSPSTVLIDEASDDGTYRWPDEWRCREDHHRSLQFVSHNCITCYGSVLLDKGGAASLDTSLGVKTPRTGFRPR